MSFCVLIYESLRYIMYTMWMCTRLQFKNGSIAPDDDIFNVQLQQTTTYLYNITTATADKGNFMQHTSALLHQTEAPHRKFLWVCGVNL